MKLRKLLIAIAALCILGGGALAIWIAQLNVKDITALVEGKVEQATGRELRIGGPITLKFSLIPTIAVEDVHFQNAAWGSKPDMLSVQHAEIQLALLPLLRSQIALRKIVLTEPKVLLEVSAKGEKNWVFNAEDKAQDPQHKLTINIAELRIEHGAIDYRPAAPAQPQTISIDTLSLQSSGGAQATIDTKLIVNQVPVELAGVIPNPTRFGSASAPIDLKIACGDARFTLSGEIPAQVAQQSTPSGSPLEGADLHFTAQADNPSGLAKQFQVTLPHLPKTLIEGHAHIAKSILQVDLDKVQLGSSNVRAQLRASLDSQRPSVTASMDAPLVDMKELFGPLVPPKVVVQGGRLFSDTPFPLKPLSTIDVQADIKVARLVLRDGRPLQDLAVKFDLQHGKLLADPVSLSVQGKPLRARIQADASNGRSLSVNVSIEGKGIPLASLAVLANVAAVPEGAPTDLSIRFSGNGASLRQVMASGSGDVQVSVGPGRWKGHAFELGADVTELFKAIFPVGSAGDYTDLQCAVIRFPVKQGVARIDNGIGIETTKVKVLAFGVIDLRDESLKLGFRPKAGTGLGVGVGNFAQLVRVGGTLSKPGVEVDAAGAATTLLELGLAASTDGGSLLAQRLFADKSVDHPCQTALGKSVVKGEAAKTGKVSDGQQAPASPVDALKRLFGG